MVCVRTDLIGYAISSSTNLCDRTRISKKDSPVGCDFVGKFVVIPPGRSLSVVDKYVSQSHNYEAILTIIGIIKEV